jgi:hypothetical protein
VAGLEPTAYGGYKDASAAWAAGVLRLGAWPVAVGHGPEGRERPQDLQELWQERTAIMVYDGQLPPAEAARLAWAGLRIGQAHGLVAPPPGPPSAPRRRLRHA